jgi:trimeric autotransporter adhesin
MKKIYTIIILVCITPTLHAQSWNITGNSGLTTSNFLGSADNHDVIFKANNAERGRLAAAGFWRFGNATNYAKVDSTGKLTFGGTGAYQVAGNKYAFQYTGNTNYGLFFNSTSVQYEFRNGSAAPVFSINANTGNSVFNGTVKIGVYTLPSTDGANGQVLSTNGSGTVSWSNVSGSSGANKTLSNLTAPTAINVDLLPGNDNAVSLGSSTKGWKNIYMDSALYMGGTKFLTGNASLNNTGVGLYALSSNTTGLYNTANGYQALMFNTTGGENTATGLEALLSNIIGYYNTANGADALLSNTTGGYNTANGAEALYSNISGGENTANGYAALYNNRYGSDNTANGYQALFSNTTGFDNMANGYGALSSNTTGGYNTANGAEALYSNTTGTNNTADGLDALSGNTIGIDNTANGVDALNANSTGNYNTGVGVNALISTTASEFNTAIGFNAGYSYDNGYNNVFVGANTDVNGAGYYNVVAIGKGTICTDVSQARIGNSATTSIGGYANWTNISDGRVKKNIKQNVPGLAFINKLQPVTYNLDLDAIDKIVQYVRKDSTGKAVPYNKAEQTARLAKEKVVYTGFVAQDVEKIAKNLNYDFSGVDAAKNDKDLYGLRYAEFVVPLVKAVQELSKMNDAQNTSIDSLKNQNNTQQIQIDNLQNQINELKAMIVSKQSTPLNKQAGSISVAALEQNIPNPFNNTTKINYTLPQKFTSAEIMITDKNGKTLKAVNVSGSGKGSLNVDASILASGAYQYSLNIDGKLIAAKQMVLVK